MTDAARQQWDGTYKTRPMVADVQFAIRAAEYLKGMPHCVLLDIGCGDGRDALFFAERGMTVTAIDFSKEAIARVRAVSPAIEARVMDITAMEFPDAGFDAIYAHLSLHYFDDETTDAVFRNIHRMLKPGGFFFVKCKSTKDPLYGKGKRLGPDLYHYKHTRHFFNREYLAEKLRIFSILSLEETSALYDGKRSEFVEAMARKG